jgi:hypothetical protein
MAAQAGFFEWTRPDPDRRGVTRIFRRIPDMGGRVLRPIGHKAPIS